MRLLFRVVASLGLASCVVVAASLFVGRGAAPSLVVGPSSTSSIHAFGHVVRSLGQSGGQVLRYALPRSRDALRPGPVVWEPSTQVHLSRFDMRGMAVAVTLLSLLFFLVLRGRRGPLPVAAPVLPVKSRVQRRRRAAAERELALLEDLDYTMGRLERRIESLETIVMR